MGITYCSYRNCRETSCVRNQCNAPEDCLISLTDMYVECPTAQSSGVMDRPKLPRDKFAIQMVSDNYDVKHNPGVREKYPNLYDEVVKHDLISNSSWYNLSKEAHDEYWEYHSDETIGYVY